ncbi:MULTISPECIES: hypothetical protein [unclassified Microcoleus]|uniref:hypothetical protein n=1 Tax=unclassified Microcoleus TaxID=2642155 RepID=UPI002FD67C8E
MKQLFFQGMSKQSRLGPGSKAFGKYERLRSIVAARNADVPHSDGIHKFAYLWLQKHLNF